MSEGKRPPSDEEQITTLAGVLVAAVVGANVAGFLTLLAATVLEAYLFSDGPPARQDLLLPLLWAILWAAAGAVASPIGVYAGRAVGRRSGRSRLGTVIGGTLALAITIVAGIFLYAITLR